MSTNPTISIRYTLSQAGQKASLLAGGNGKSTQLISGEITPEEISHPLIRLNQDGTINTVPLEAGGTQLVNPGWGEPRLEWLTLPPFDVPLSFAQAWQLAREYYETTQAQRIALQPEYEAALAAHRAREAAQAAEKRAQKQRNEEYEASREAKKTALAALLHDWATAHGSPLLRARLEEGFSWPGLARREYADNVLSSVGLPAGYSWGDACQERERPTLEEIETLRHYREALGDRATVALAWYQPTAVDDTGYPLEDQPTAETALAVDVDTPDARTVNRVIPLSEIAPQ